MPPGLPGGDAALLPVLHRYTCQAFGTPNVTISWLRGGLTLTGSGYKVTSVGLSPLLVRSSLEVVKVTSNHYSNYTCLASNDLGDARQQVSNNNFSLYV